MSWSQSSRCNWLVKYTLTHLVYQKFTSSAIDPGAGYTKQGSYSAIVEIRAGTWDGCMPCRDKLLNKWCNFSNFNQIIWKILLRVSNEIWAQVLCLCTIFLGCCAFLVANKPEKMEMEFWWKLHVFFCIWDIFIGHVVPKKWVMKQLKKKNTCIGKLVGRKNEAICQTEVMS